MDEEKQFEHICPKCGYPESPKESWCLECVEYDEENKEAEEEEWGGQWPDRI